jgi:rifampin ADP-ribosylating transferase
MRDSSDQAGLTMARVSPASCVDRRPRSSGHGHCEHWEHSRHEQENPPAMTYARDATPPFYHGTRADLKVGDLLAPGFNSNYQARKLSWIYFSGTLDAATWGAELAKGPEGNENARERIYMVAPTGAFEDDPNLTDTKFTGNPTAAYRSRAPLRITGEVETWEPHSPERLAEMKTFLARLAAEGDMKIID